MWLKTAWCKLDSFIQRFKLPMSYDFPYDWDMPIHGQRWAASHRRKPRPHWGRKWEKSVEPSIDWVADHEVLLAAYDQLRAEGGQSPGPDGLTYRQLSRSEAADLLRTVAKAIQQGSYRPGPGRQVRVPKPAGGYRVLTIRSILDRVVSKALNDALTPFFEKIFRNGSYGFRPKRSPWHLLADLERDVIEHDRNVLVVDDVRKAFDNLPIVDVMTDHHAHLKDLALLALIEVVLRGSDGTGRIVGIDQGSPYSPLALNLRMHYLHDVGISESSTSPLWYRFADNLAYLCHNEPEGQEVLEQVRRRLKAGGLDLKGEDGEPVDLRDGKTQLLGFTITRQEDRLAFRPGKKAFNSLYQSLVQAHEEHESPRHAKQAITGWLAFLGPTFESCADSDLIHTVLRGAAKLGFREVGNTKSLKAIWKDGWERWQAYRKVGDMPAGTALVSA
jgi:retron-type reverse transcriptase